MSDGRRSGRLGSLPLVAAVLVSGVACDGTPPPFDAPREVAVWVALWETHDLDALGDVFAWDSSLTYLSSEREGLIVGPEAVTEHHRAMGFVAGGRAPTQALRLEDVHATVFGGTAVVTALWVFGDREGPAEAWQRGPMTAVYRWTDGTWRIAHMHFADYEP